MNFFTNIFNMWYSFIKKAQGLISGSDNLSSRSQDWFLGGGNLQSEETLPTDTTKSDIPESTPQEPQEPISTDWLSNAKLWLGTPYVFGGNSKSGIDCSAFVQKILPDKGLPRTANEQMKVGSDVPKEDISAWSPKDRVYFDMGPRLGSGNNVADHTGVYIGGNQFIQASSSKGVTISDISPNSFYYNKLIAVKR